MGRVSRLCAVLCVLGSLLFASKIIATNLTSSLPSSANIMPNCQFMSENISLSFGSYDPINANITNTKEAATTFRLRCIKGTSAIISINNGLNAMGDVRRMRGAGQSYLNYELYTSANRTTVWNTTNTVSYSANNPQPKQFSIYGRIPAGQDVSAGAYTDTVTLSVTF